MGNGLVKQEPPQPPAAASATANDIMRLAIQEHVDAESLEKIAAMIERRERWDAERAFNAAMVACQAELKPVSRDAHNKQTNSYYAKLDNIGFASDPIIAKHGFSMSFGEERADKDGWVRTVCDVRHAAGHSVRYHIELPPDDKGIAGKVNKTLIHGVASTHTYGERLLTCKIFKIRLGEFDDDGQRGVDFITPDEIGELNDLIGSAAEARAKMPADILAMMLDAYEIPSLDQLPTIQLMDAKMRLRKQINARS